MAEFFAELKRRHIYRVGAAYVVVAWALAQGIELLSQIFELSGSIARPAVILLAIGFPVALIAAWMIESKPHQAVASAVHSKPTAVDWTLIGALAVVLLFMGYRQLAPTPQAGVDAARSASLDPRIGVSLAVLPFANLSDDETQTFFSDGITEEIITALARIPDLRVVARESASQFKGERRDLRAVGQSLGATHLIEGSVRKAGARVRITARLVKADDGVNAWSSTYDRELNDVFAIQEEIATSIAGALRMPLGLNPGEQLVSNRAIDAESYEQFLRGKVALGRARFAYAEQLALLEPVVSKNPNYAPAWAALARAYRFAMLAGQITPGEEYARWRATYEPKMLAAARRAAELDPNSADVKVTLGITELGPRRWTVAEGFLLDALALDPNHGEALSFYGGVLLAVGRVKEAVAMKLRLNELEPYVPLYAGNLGEALWIGGQDDAAIAVLKDNLARSGAGARMGLMRISASLGRYSEAADLMSAYLSNESPVVRRIAAEAMPFLRSAPAKVASTGSLPGLSVASFIYLHVGAPERALDPYEEGFSTGSDVGLLWHPSYAPARKTERFKKIARDLGLVDYWRAKGWSEWCRPVGADDFACE